MSGLFDGVVPFVFTARHRSFRKAAQELEVTPAAISKAVARLETELGVELLHRTTRRVELSDEGAVFLARCEEAMRQVQDGRDLLALARRAPRGDLTVSLPFVFGRFLVARLHTFTARYPALRLHLRFTDRKVRLVDDRVDVAIRVGPLADSAMTSRLLGRTRWVTVASPGYLARRGTPASVEELSDHTCLRFRAPRGKLVPWSFRDHPVLDVEAAVDLDQGSLLVDAALAGLGIVQVFASMVREHVRAGRLVEILPDEAVAGPAVHAVCLPAQRSTPRVRAFIDFLGECFGRSFESG